MKFPAKSWIGSNGCVNAIGEGLVVIDASHPGKPLKACSMACTFSMPGFEPIVVVEKDQVVSRAASMPHWRRLRRNFSPKLTKARGMPHVPHLAMACALGIDQHHFDVRIKLRAD
jgi:hypothetical protein